MPPSFSRFFGQMLCGRLDSIHDRDGVAVAALLQNRNVDRMLSVDAHDVRLNCAGVFGLADIADHHRAQSHRFQRNLVHLFRARHLAVGVDVVVLGADAHVAGGQDQVRLVHRLHHVHH
jgi:hypothetical protein